ncbi:Hypothetical predicted protein [Cloeon dipterum]|uniref:WWE domain-containing protein n=1 Tax=Cloeon dipterum TaxID=197152 RepID=A0A8S1C8H4_9INSE|nr:Hypothetical predicted protein [Cloeon dipterum]
MTDGVRSRNLSTNFQYPTSNTGNGQPLPFSLQPVITPIINATPQQNPALTGPRWQFERRNKTWQDFDPNHQVAMDTAYSSGSQKYTFSFNGNHYDVDFAAGTQTRQNEPGNVRKIRKFDPTPPPPVQTNPGTPTSQANSSTPTPTPAANGAATPKPRTVGQPVSIEDFLNLEVTIPVHYLLKFLAFFLLILAILRYF